MQGAEFEQVYDFGNLYAGFLKARRGKRHKPSVAKFEANLLEALCLLSEMLKTKTYRPSDYFVFKVYEPKERIVMTNAFKDKVVQHSLCDNILEPAFSKAFIRDNYASQSGRGTHDGLYRLEEFMRSYYIVDSTENPGIPIGNQTSQWFAVMYLSGMDHFIKEKLGIRYYGRYMDDFYLIHEDKAYLQYCRGEIEQYVARLGLRMNKKTNIFPLRNGIDFLGFHTYLTESGKIIRKVRRSSKCNAQRKLKKQRGLLDREKISLSDIEQSYGSWRSHAVKGNCYHLIQKTDSLFQNLFKESEKQWPKV